MNFFCFVPLHSKKSYHDSDLLEVQKYEYDYYHVRDYRLVFLVDDDVHVLVYGNDAYQHGEQLLMYH